MIHKIINNILQNRFNSHVIYSASLEEFEELKKDAHNNMIPTGLLIIYNNDVLIFIDSKWCRLCVCDY